MFMESGYHAWNHGANALETLQKFQIDLTKEHSDDGKFLPNAFVAL